MKNDLFGALIGLATTCATNQKTEHTDEVIVEALRLAADQTADEAAFAAMTEKVREEKFTIVPGCRYCDSPCGNTSDYDLSLLSIYPPEIRDVKMQILQALTERIEKFKDQAMMLYKGLSFVSYDMDEEALKELLAELSKQEA